MNTVATRLHTGIRMFDYVEQYASIQEEILAAVSDVLASGSLILGPQVRAFEEEFAEFLDVPGYAVGVASGTDALAVALRALEVGPGDEVITVANTAVPTASAIRMTGAKIVFCEIDPDTLLMDLTDVEERITSRTRAVVPVHLYGNVVDVPRLVQIAQRRGVAVVEDCAQSCGSTWRSRQTGTFGDVGCFSFYPTKNLGAYGDGGLCFTRRADLAARMRAIRAYGCDDNGQCQRAGVNSRLDELQAAILRVKLRYLPSWLTKRRGVAATYRWHLDREIGRPRVAASVDHSYHLFVIESALREQIISKLKAEGIGCGVHYPVPLHHMRGLRDSPDEAPPPLAITEQMSWRVLSLPCYPELSLEAVQEVCRLVNDCVHAKH